jgi:hypothetical protein
MILKEWTCNCGHKFDSFAPLCTRCGGIANRAFRTPVGITTGIVGKSDRLLASEFKARGISNYTNVHGTPKVTWSTGGGSDIKAGWGDQGLANLNKQYNTNFQVTPTATIPGIGERSDVASQFKGKFKTQIIGSAK